MTGLLGRGGRESHTESTRLAETDTRSCPLYSTAWYTQSVMSSLHHIILYATYLTVLLMKL